MKRRLVASLALLALAATACGGHGGSSALPSVSTQSASRTAHTLSSGSNVVSDSGFESGGFSNGWTQCGSVTSKSSITTAQAHSGSYSALNGSTSSPEVNGTAGICQTVIVPAGGTLTFWVNEGSSDTIKYVDQEADLLTTSGANITQLYKEAASTSGWVEKTFDLSSYAGQTVQLYFGVKGNGYSKDYVYQYVDDVSLTGSSTATPSPTATPSAAPTSTPTTPPATGVSDPGFESGGFSAGWRQCGSVTSQSTVTTAQAHSGNYSALNGSTSNPEVNGTAAVCQTVTVPTGATLTFWVDEGTNDTVQYADQEADLLTTSGTNITQLYKEAASTSGWVEKSFDLSAYAGQTLQLYFGVKGNGWTGGHVYQYVDDVSLSGGTSTPTPPPTATPFPTATPSSAPTSTPTAGPYACNDPQFLTYQSEFASGQITADQFVNVCGSVTQVLAKKKTSSGTHGYFYVQIPNGGTIEIVSNLDAMAQASTDAPPTTWPWVAVGDYVYVQGRYYYDSSSSQGIDWTEDDTSGSWPHTGDVVVCNSSGQSCSFYW